MSNDSIALYLEGKISKIWSKPFGSLNIETLAGDASNRKYHRVFEYGKSQNNRQLIVMELYKPQLDSELDFIVMTRYLSYLGLLVPKLFYYDKDKGFLFLEDLGDQLLNDLVGPEADQGEKIKWYRKAIDILILLQLKGLRKPGLNCPAFGRRFDLEKLMFEIDFMIKHFIIGLKKKYLLDNEVKEIQNVLEILCQRLSNEETVLTHRDFHSRNIMVKNEELKIIDFQDARLGPRQYDLVSLLRDSYVELDDSFVEEMIDYFINRLEESGVEEINRVDFRKIFDFYVGTKKLKSNRNICFSKDQNGNESLLRIYSKIS